MQVASVLVIIVFAIGMPVMFVYVIHRAIRTYQSQVTSLQKGDRMNDALIMELAKENDADVETAEYVMRDAALGQEFSFLMNAFKPTFVYW